MVAGPMLVGLIIKFKGASIAEGSWGIQVTGQDEKTGRASEIEGSASAVEEGSIGNPR